MAIDIVDHNCPYDNYNIYDVIFFDDSIRTTITWDPNMVSEWISEVEHTHRRRLHRLIIGLDIEWRPSFNGNTSSNQVATLQLCVGHRCLIFVLIYTPFIPCSLVDFLANPNYTFVGVGIKEDVEKLQKDYEFGFNTNTVDLIKQKLQEDYDFRFDTKTEDLRDLEGDENRRMEFKDAGVKALASLMLGKEFEKPRRVTTSELDGDGDGDDDDDDDDDDDGDDDGDDDDDEWSGWDNELLTHSQVQYACLDAFLCFEIGKILIASYSSSSSAPSPLRISFYLLLMCLLCYISV